MDFRKVTVRQFIFASVAKRDTFGFKNCYVIKNDNFEKHIFFSRRGTMVKGFSNQNWQASKTVAFVYQTDCDITVVCEI